MISNTANPFITPGVHQWNLSTAYDIGTTAAPTFNLDTATQTTQPSGLEFSSDGTKMFIVASNTYLVYQYTLSSPWNINSAIFDTSYDFSAVTPLAYQPQGIAFSANGGNFYIFSNNEDKVLQLTTG